MRGNLRKGKKQGNPETKTEVKNVELKEEGEERITGDLRKYSNLFHIYIFPTMELF